ncbi:MAG: hypothetical protein JXK05_13905 [Campylobacterales bacterium]|nr:hypothetical protein [Campylobacterales bacterium]
MGFALRLWLYWLWWVLLYSVAVAAATAAVLVGVIYVLKGAPALDADVYGALEAIARVVFVPLWCAALLWAHLMVTRRLFACCLGGRRLILLTCKGDERIYPVGLGDVLPVWRRFLMLIVWIVAVEVLLLVGVTSLWGGMSATALLRPSVLGAMSALGAFAALLVLLGRCKCILVTQC